MLVEGRDENEILKFLITKPKFLLFPLTQKTKVKEVNIFPTIKHKNINDVKPRKPFNIHEIYHHRAERPCMYMPMHHTTNCP